MPQFDRLFASMAQRNASRAILLSDQPMQLVIGDQTVSGAPITGTNLLTMLAEIVPANQQASLQQNGQFESFYPTPQGTMRVNITREGEALRAVIDKMPDAVAQVSSPQPFFDTLNPNVPFNTATPTAPAAPSPTPQTPMSPAPYGGSPYPVAPGYGEPNSSGGGAMAPVPPEIQGKWNWGAFFGSWIWGIANGTWLALLALLPCVWMIMPFVLGFKGNEWAWRNKRFNSMEEFKKNQTTWGIVGFAVQCIFGFVVVLPMLTLMLGLAAMGPVGVRAHSNALRASSQSNLKQISLSTIEFTQDNKDTFPTGRTLGEWKAATLRYSKAEDLYVSPSTQEPYSVNPSLSGIGIAQVTDAANTPMFYEKTKDDLGGHNIAFTDGHVKWYKEDDWRPYRTYLDSVGAE